jgi:hypothetical protein
MVKLIQQSITKGNQTLWNANHSGFVAQDGVCDDSQTCPKEAVFAYINPMFASIPNWKKSSQEPIPKPATRLRFGLVCMRFWDRL